MTKAISYLEFNIVLFCKFVWIGGYVVIAYKIWVPYCAFPSANRVWRLLNCIYRKREAALGACGREMRGTLPLRTCALTPSPDIAYTFVLQSQPNKEISSISDYFKWSEDDRIFLLKSTMFLYTLYIYYIKIVSVLSFYFIYLFLYYWSTICVLLLLCTIVSTVWQPKENYLFYL